MSSNLTVEALRQELAALDLDTHGKREQLRQRLKKARAKARQVQQNRDKELSEAQKPWSPKYKNYLVLDVEATCQQRSRGGGFNYPNESTCVHERPVEGVI